MKVLVVFLHGEVVNEIKLKHYFKGGLSRFTDKVVKEYIKEKSDEGYFDKTLNKLETCTMQLKESAEVEQSRRDFFKNKID